MINFFICDLFQLLRRMSILVTDATPYHVLNIALIFLISINRYSAVALFLLTEKTYAKSNDSKEAPT